MIKKTISFCSLLFILCLTINNYGFALEWTTSVIDDAKNFTMYQSNGIFIDNNGYPHIVYGGDHLYYSYLDETGWHHETVDLSQDVGTHSRIAIDSFGKAHIIYFDTKYNCLKYASNSSNAWEIVSLDISPSSHQPISMTIDSSGKLHICHYDYNSNSIKYSTNSDGEWTTIDINIFDINSAGNISILADSSNNIHICFIEYTQYYEGLLKYATNISGIWEISLIESIGYYNSGDFTKIAVDQSGNLHVSYSVTNKVRFLPGSCSGDCYFTDFKYATNISGSWTSNTVGTTGHYSSLDDTLPNGDRYYFGLSVDLSGAVNFYYLYYDEGIKFASNSTGSWLFSTIDSDGIIKDVSGYIGNYLALVLDISGNVHLSFFDETSDSIKYASNTTGAWDTSIVAVCNQAGQYTSTAIDSHDKLWLSYYNSSSGDLNLATNSSGFWTHETVDNVGNVGMYNSISLDSTGNAHISYFDETNETIKYATNSSGGWDVQDLELPETVYKNTSIALDSTNKVYILYFDMDNNELKYASKTSGGWTTFSTTASDSSYSLSMDMAFDNSDNMHICYYDGFNLKYATNSSGDWVSETLGSTYPGLSKSRNCTIVIDSEDNIHIAYQGYGGSYDLYDLRYISNISGSWVNELVDSGYGMGNYCSSTIDKYDKIHLSYLARSNLKYATNSSGTWRNESLSSYCLGSNIVISSISDDIYIPYGCYRDGDLKYLTTALPYLAGDINGDGDVDGFDLAELVNGIVAGDYDESQIADFATKYGITN